MRYTRSIAGVLVAAQAFGLAAGTAHAETRERVDVTVSATAASNPFFVSGNDTAAVSVSLAADPVVTISNEITNVVLDGHLRLDQYLENYGLDANFSLGANARTRLSERTSLFGSLGAASNIPRGSDLIILEGETLLQPPADFVVAPPLGDITTTGQRLNTYLARAGVEHQLSSRDNLTGSISSGYTDASGTLGVDYGKAGLQVIYGRQLSEGSRLRASLDVEGVNYTRGSLGDATYATPMLGIERAIGSRVTLAADIGATLTHINTGLNSHRETAGLAANVNACRRGEKSTWCAIASRAVEPTSTAGLSTITTAALSYNLQTSVSGSLSVGASYGRTSSIVDDPVFPDLSYEFVGASASYSRELNKRLFGVVSSSISSRSSSLSGGSQENLQVQIGIRSRFGNLK